MKERSVGNTVMVIDGGGRGDVLAKRYAESEYVDRVIAVPGNPMMQIGVEKPVHTHPQLKTTSVADIVDIAMSEGVNLVDVAQDNAVAVGVADALRARGIPTIGPSKTAGQIEWDKGFTRKLGLEEDIPQPTFQICMSEKEALALIDESEDRPRFVKYFGLAAGRGSLPAGNNSEARERIREAASDYGMPLVIEDWIGSDDGTAGEEFSTFLISDGINYELIGNAQDHKRAYDHDEGPNTGGMGVSTPPLVLRQELIAAVKSQIIDKVIGGLAARGRHYNGIMYIGGMIVTEKGELTPKLVEINARWGDPEVEAILPGIIGDLYEISMAAATSDPTAFGDIGGINLRTDRRARVVVAGASRGYPGDYSKVLGQEIYGLDEVRKMHGVRLYGAGVKVEDGRYYANGGRLFYVVGEGETVIDARQRAYEAISLVSVRGNNLHYRTDIGWRDVERMYSNKK